MTISNCCFFRQCIHQSNMTWSILKNQLKYFHITAGIRQIKSADDSPLNIFDRKAKRLQKERAATCADVQDFDYIKGEIGERLSDRIFDIKREFNTVVDLGCGRGHVSKYISSDNVKKLVCCDLSDLLAQQASCEDEKVQVIKKEVDEEFLSNSITAESVDLVISNLSLHWVNDLPLCFNEVMKILKSDGVFMGSIFGGDTLYELRSSLQLAEMERLGGLAPHISPFARVRDVGSLLTRAGFTMQTIDTEEVIVGYPSMIALMHDLKGMGESNAAWNRKLHLRRDVISAASVLYNQLYGKEENGRFGIPATYQIIYFLGWKPDPSQPQPIGRGTGEVSLKDLYRIDEIVRDKRIIETEDK